LALSLREREKGESVLDLPLTPALSPKERGKSQSVLDLSPLPVGEG